MADNKPAETVDTSADVKETTVKQTTQEDKPKKGKGRLGCLVNVILLAVAAVVLIKAAKEVPYMIDPVENNRAEQKYLSISTAVRYISGFTPEFAREKVIDYVGPLFDGHFMQEDSEVIGNKKLEKIRTAEYTIEDEELVEGYTGLRVEITGNITGISDEGKTASMVIGVNREPYTEEGESREITLNNFFVKDLSPVAIGNCVKVEGYLVMSPGNFSEGVAVELSARNIEAVDFIEAGGKKSEAYRHVMTEPAGITGTKDELNVEITSVVVDKKTGRANVKYKYYTDSRRTWIEVIGTKGSLSGWETVYGEGKTNYSELVIENPVDESAEKDKIVLHFCAYDETVEEEWEDDREPYVNPDAPIYLQIEIPSDQWVIYE